MQEIYLSTKLSGVLSECSPINERNGYDRASSIQQCFCSDEGCGDTNSQSTVTYANDGHGEELEN